ncbi:MAG: EVE domain-containing protein [Shewanella sp.]|nr:EVE domain-containing protein [Shewanella sp.]MCF1431857.1 EVE domain-containing protein [Shewanella sp.]MCF1439540.1 EVE domain-containing protein [Shewanella sp.]MCF1459434.1 EVE domain-containing protein [Shewanella sp.]
MNYWLMKSEPDEFSIDDLQHVGTEPWTGIRNYQARNYMRDSMQIGDQILFYHSSCKVPVVAGIAEVASAPYTDFSAFNANSRYFDPKSSPDNPRWQLVDIRFVSRLPKPVTLKQIKAHPQLTDMALVNHSRQSIQPVTAQQWQQIMTMAGA